MENANHSKDLFQKVFREFECNCLEVDVVGVIGNLQISKKPCYSTYLTYAN